MKPAPVFLLAGLLLAGFLPAGAGTSPADPVLRYSFREGETRTYRLETRAEISLGDGAGRPLAAGIRGPLTLRVCRREAGGGALLEVDPRRLEQALFLPGTAGEPVAAPAPAVFRRVVGPRGDRRPPAGTRRGDGDFSLDVFFPPLPEGPAPAGRRWTSTGRLPFPSGAGAPEAAAYRTRYTSAGPADSDWGPAIRITFDGEKIDAAGRACPESRVRGELLFAAGRVVAGESEGLLLVRFAAADRPGGDAPATSLLETRTRFRNRFTLASAVADRP